MEEGGAAPDLEGLEIRPVCTTPTSQAEAGALEWVAAHRQSGAPVVAGEVFSAAGHEFAVVACRPGTGGRVVEETEVASGGAPVPVLNRVQLVCFDGDLAITDDGLFDALVRPLLLDKRAERRRKGGRFLVVLSEDQVLKASGHEFGVMALDPACRYGAVEVTTSVYTRHEERPALAKIHVLPYEDSLPAAYTFDLFQDFVRPFFSAHPFGAYGEGDHFTFRGVRFRVMAVDPRGAPARVGRRTLVFSAGEALRPTVLDLLPPELRQDLQRLPRGLQAMLLNTMANEEAVRSRLTEVHEVLRPGQGLGAAEIGRCGRPVTWLAAERVGDAQKQCMVCLCEFSDGECLRELACSHLFHQGCIDEWLRRSAACPICKRPVVSADSQAPVPAPLVEQNAHVVWGNGLDSRTGIVMGYDVARQRLRVLFEGGSGEEELVPPEEVAQRVSVQLTGLQNEAYNGLSGEVVGLDASSGRYQVRIEREGERCLSVMPDHCILPDGVFARVVGLRGDSASARWNGHYGCITGFDRARMRHGLTMPPRDNILSIKPKNLRL